MQTDSPWKEILDEFFPDFTRMLFPELYAAVEWSRGFRSLDKELAGLGGGARSGRGGNKGTLIVDKLLSVYGRDGEDMRVLIHIESVLKNHRTPYCGGETPSAALSLLRIALLFGVGTPGIWHSGARILAHADSSTRF